MMKVLQKILFACVMTVGFAVAGYSQDKPPKNPPVINPGKPAPTPQPTPPKKPNYAFVVSDIGSKKYLG